MVTENTIDSPSIRQLSRREPSWVETEVATIAVGAESIVGTGGVAAFFADVCCKVLACGEEACSREKAVDPGVPEGCVGLFVGLSAFVDHFNLIDPKKGLSFEVLIRGSSRNDSPYNKVGVQPRVRTTGHLTSDIGLNSSICWE